MAEEAFDKPKPTHKPDLSHTAKGGGDHADKDEQAAKPTFMNQFAPKEGTAKKGAETEAHHKAEEVAKPAEPAKVMETAKPVEEAKPAETAVAAYIAEHKVVGGDTLSGIAHHYYGSSVREKWMLIYEANKETIGANPSLIRVGQVLKIPKLD